ncbi:hypothetical protein OY671_013149, partial [Metschnikowia pulcherrima]
CAGAAGYPARVERRTDAQVCGGSRRGDPGVDGWPVRRAGHASRLAPARRRDDRRRVSPPPLCRRRARFPLLHAQPGRTELRNSPPDWPHDSHPILRPRRAARSGAPAHSHPRWRLRHRDPASEAVRGGLCRH